MLTMNNIRLIINTKNPTLRAYYAGKSYCQLRIYRNNYKNLFQACSYSTKYVAKNNDVRSAVDPRVETLRAKLLYCDYLNREKVRMGYMKRFLMQKKLEFIKRKELVDKLVNEPVYSIFVQPKNDKEDYEELKEEIAEVEEDIITPVHMPYANTDNYNKVHMSQDNFDTANDVNESEMLNEKYKNLYEEYLTMKTAASNDKKDNLGEYIKEMNISTSYKTDLSNIPPNWMTDVEEYDDTLDDNTWINNYGTPDPNSSVSSTPCNGCGALLHCKDYALPGYLPSELFRNKKKQELQLMICQRCHFLKYYKTALEVKVRPEEYAELLKVIKTKKCAVILMVDLTDFPCSIWPEIKSVLHPYTSVFVVGNKIDLLPQDSPRFLDHVKKCLLKAVESTGIEKRSIKHVQLISAKTGYGIEELINKMHYIWEYKGDVFVIGCTNVGKSSLFNTLLQSDYCKVQAADLIQRATTSPWPGTTLNLLKFPILNPVRWKLYLRTMRLRKEKKNKYMEEQSMIEQFKTTRNLQYATLQSHIGRTFLPEPEVRNDIFSEKKYNKYEQTFGFDENEEIYKYSRWCYDTPGTIQPDQVLDLLTIQELMLVLPNKIISPRTFILHANQTIFLGGIGRLDYVGGDHFIRCTIFASNKLPVTVVHTVDADSIYNELIQTKAFVVPDNNPDRLKHWPSLGCKEMEVTGIGKSKSAADVVLSSAGWIAITAVADEQITLKAWTPQGRGLHLRTPALLEKSVTLRGDRVIDAPTYRSGRQVYKK